MKRSLAGAATLAFFLGPLFWQLLTSFWPEAELSRPLPSSLTFENYAGLGGSFARAAVNSLAVAAATTALSLSLAAAAGFAIAKLELRGKTVLLGGALAISMFPPIATVSPLYLALRAAGLRDSLAGLVLPYTAFALPLSLWLLTTSFRELPDELYRAARVDGCTPWQAFVHVFLPLSWPALATTGILVFIFSWNELLFALAFVSSPSRRTIPAAIALFAGEHVEPWGQIAAASVVLVGLRKAFPGARDALRGLSLEVADGEFLSLVGPSGCGKSTTLGIIAGLDEPTSGEVRIDGRSVNGLSPGERDVAMVFQSYALYPHKSVRANLSFPLEVQRLPRAEIDRRVARTAAQLGIEQLLARKPRELSGGQRQRVALGRALVREPRVYLFDEPLSNLDAGLRAQMRAELKRLHRQLRATFIYVTHDQAEAMTLSDRIALLREGELQQVAAPREIYEKPANRFVAEFFGTPRINLVPPPVLGLEGDGLIGARPEHLELLPAPAPGARKGVVELCELAGAETWVTVAVEGVPLVVRAASELALAQGSPAWIRPVPARLLRFGMDGARL